MDSQQLDELAWDVVAATRPHLTVQELNVVFVKLGIGDHESAIEIALSRAITDQVELPPALTVRLRGWVDGFAGNPIYDQVDHLLTVNAAHR